VIITVFVTSSSEEEHWCAELLEHSWIQAGQSGELVRLVACGADARLPMHSMARVVRTMPYNPHPYLDDEFPGYNFPAALLEWLYSEAVDATLLLLDARSIFLEALEMELSPEEAIGNTWREWPTGEGPFGLADHYVNLRAFCVNRKLKPPKVQWPVLIHSSELKKMAARWLELTALIRCEVNEKNGRPEEAHKVAYTVAAAEYAVRHKSRKIASAPADRRADRAVLTYAAPVCSVNGDAVWEADSYQPWSECDPAQARAGAGRVFLSRLKDYVAMRRSGEHLGLRRPRRCPGVREAHLPDRMVLQVPGIEQPLNLNSSAAAIWRLCDSTRTLADIADELEQRFEVPREELCADIDRAINLLHTGGAVDLESVHS
jgi:hypothetical protein